MTKSFLSFLMAFLSGFSLIFSQTVDTLQGLNDETISLNTFGAISKADAGTFNKGHINHPYDLIRGKIAGLAVSKAGSNPNGFYEMRVRGLRTMDGNSFPAIIIDGVIGAFPENVDPNDIESIALLKDAAAASLYGLRGGSGVLIIETKKG
ncbi:MAG TPA: TonB-dependent receptor plug domain-containing protein, partial [Bacteroidales bacterium]|nr:TonB-dependent receptor plug domain-containing protein [Bacteroidales bacterium]